MDKQRFVKAITALHEYYGKDISSAVMELYWIGLCQHTNEELESAVMRHIANPDTGQWMPKVADLVKMMEGTTQDSAWQAWTKVERGISSAGTYRSVAFDDPIIHLVIDDMGGWIELCQTQAKEIPFIQKRFEQIYRSYKIRGELPPHKPYLIGSAEAQNNMKGYPSDPPKLIGNPELAQRTLQLGSDKPKIPVTVAQVAVKALESLADEEPF